MKEPGILIAERLRTAREEAKLTTAEVARKAQLKPEYITRIESGRDPNLTVPALLKWCEALGVQPSAIVANLGLEKGGKR